MTRVVVLGGGIAGLTAAFRRRWEGSDSETVVLESGSRVGGSIRTVVDGGLVLEAGPNTLRTNAATERLLADLGLEGEVVEADPRAPRYVYRKGRPRAIVPGPRGLFTKAISLGGKLRVLREPFVPGREWSREDESVHDFFLRRFGPELARYAAGPIVSGVYADDPATLSVRSAFPSLWDAEERGGSVLRGFLKRDTAPGPRPPRVRSRTLTFRRGLRALPETLSERLDEMGAAVQLECEVSAIEGPLPPGRASRRWRVVTADGRVFEADRVLSTLDALRLASLLGPRLPRSGSRLTALSYSRLAVVLQAWRAPSEKAAPKGFGVLVPRGEGLKALGILYPASLFPGRAEPGVALTTSFLGGALEPGLPGLSDAELLALGEAEVRRVHPGLSERLFARVERWPAAIPRLPVGHHETLALLASDLAELDRGEAKESFLVTGAWREGVSLADRIAAGEAMGQKL